MGGVEERENLVYMAKLAEQAERHDDMVEFMKKLAMKDIELTSEERCLLSVGYKNVVTARRSSWRLLSSIMEKEMLSGNEQILRRIEEYMTRVEGEIIRISDDIFLLISAHLLPSSTSSESNVFYLKMRGDYYRYLAELNTANERNVYADLAFKAYQDATNTATTELQPTNLTRLGLALNFSVFFYEILNSHQRACQIAKQAFDEAIQELNVISEESYKDCMHILQLLKDNLELWMSDSIFGANLLLSTIYAYPDDEDFSVSAGYLFSIF
ncbi:14-3-3 protein 7 [Apostasia shenzhenica]|uniref:14-3-3 protein 7 n=1 Tax=Apostasia shenzhenica TaxID=1088818 RepID=A0A2I0AYC0_9ASPA|nr:14-3-3 protein 7 [Apostasia shenzhenica]